MCDNNRQIPTDDEAPHGECQGCGEDAALTWWLGMDKLCAECLDDARQPDAPTGEDFLRVERSSSW